MNLKMMVAERTVGAFDIDHRVVYAWRMKVSEKLSHRVPSRLRNANRALLGKPLRFPVLLFLAAVIPAAVFGTRSTPLPGSSIRLAGHFPASALNSPAAGNSEESPLGPGAAGIEPSTSPQYQWTCVNKEAAFAARDGAGALVFQNKMWLLGGWNPDDKVHFPDKGNTNSEVWVSADGTEWTLLLPKAPWEGRHTAGYAVHRDRMWIVGGDPLRGHYQNDVWSSPDGLRWDRVLENAPWAPRALHYTLVFNNKIWVMGGQTLPQFAPEKEIFYNDVWNSTDGVTWKRVLDHAPWSPRGMIGGSVVFKNRMWILGGGTYDTPRSPERNFYNDVWSSKDGFNWTKHLDHAPWEPRQYHDVAVFDGRMWVLEGWNKGNRSDVWWSEDGVGWVEVPDTPWPPRHAASVFVYDNALWMVAGNNMTPDVWKLERILDDVRRER
jgi:hypothetical protein